MPVTLKYDAQVAPSLFAAAQRFPLVAARTLNRVGASTITRASKNIRETYNVKKSVIDPLMKPSERARGDFFFFTIGVQGRPIPLKAFGAREKSAGVSAMVKIGQRKVYPHTFFATMQSGHVGVFLRVGQPQVPRKGRYRGRLVMRGPNKGQLLKRQKIQEQYRLSVADMFNSQANIEDLNAFVQEKLQSEFLAQLRYALTQANR